MTGQRRVIAEQEVRCPASGCYVVGKAARPCWSCGRTLTPDKWVVATDGHQVDASVGRLPEHTITVRRYE